MAYGAGGGGVAQREGLKGGEHSLSLGQELRESPWKGGCPAAGVPPAKERAAGCGCGRAPWKEQPAPFKRSCCMGLTPV